MVLLTIDGVKVVELRFTMDHVITMMFEVIACQQGVSQRRQVDSNDGERVAGDGEMKLR